MLVLSRKKGERVVLVYKDVRVLVEIVETRGDKTRIGFEAPDDVRIYRSELLVEDTKTNREKLKDQVEEARAIEREYEQNKKEASDNGGLGKNHASDTSALGES